MNPSADESLAFFKTNREVRLERILRAFIALDNGDEPYWWKVERSALIADAKDEVIYRGTDPNAAPQTPAEMASGSLAENGAGQRFPVPQHEDATRNLASQSAVAARDLEWVKAIHDACSNVSPADPQGKPIDPADIKRCVDAHVQICLAWIGQKRWP